MIKNIVRGLVQSEATMFIVLVTACVSSIGAGFICASPMAGLALTLGVFLVSSAFFLMLTAGMYAMLCTWTGSAIG